MNPIEYIQKQFAIAVAITATAIVLLSLTGCKTKKVVTERTAIERSSTSLTTADSTRLVHSFSDSTTKRIAQTATMWIEFASDSGRLTILPDGGVVAVGVKNYRSIGTKKREEARITASTADSATTHAESAYTKREAAIITRDKETTKTMSMPIKAIIIGLAAAVALWTAWATRIKLRQI